MALEGTFKTPLGPVPKKTAVIVGGGLVLVGAIVWYRQKQTAEQPDANVAEADINPATGYPYGSAEDAAALAQQAAYVSASPTGTASGGGNTGGSGSSNTPTYASNNAEWSQGVLAYFQDNGIIEDISGMSVALGKYITGAYVTDVEVALIQQAIAVKGQPPTAGASGYPPSLNRTPPNSGGGTVTPPPTGSTGNAGAITGRKTTATATTISATFKAAPNAVSYIVYLDGRVYKTITETSFSIGALKPNSHHTVGIQAVGANGSKGPISNTTMYTKKK